MGYRKWSFGGCFVSWTFPSTSHLHFHMFFSNAETIFLFFVFIYVSELRLSCVFLSVSHSLGPAGRVHTFALVLVPSKLCKSSVGILAQFYSGTKVLICCCNVPKLLALSLFRIQFFFTLEQLATSHNSFRHPFTLRNLIFWTTN